MLLGGLWHGASWNFVLWGFLHGLALAVHRGLRDLGWLREPGAAGGPGHVLSVLAMQYWVLLCWIPFRIQDSSKMLVAMRKFVLFDGNFSLTGGGLGKLSPFSTVLLLGGFLAIHALSARIGSLDERLAQGPRGLAFAASILAGVVFLAFWPLTDAPFIYFQF